MKLPFFGVSEEPDEEIEFVTGAEPEELGTDEGPNCTGAGTEVWVGLDTGAGPEAPGTGAGPAGELELRGAGPEPGLTTGLDGS